MSDRPHEPRCAVQVAVDVGGGTADPELVDAAGEAARTLVDLLDDDLPAGAELSLLLVDDQRMRRLNHRWRRQDRPTDVLSFPQAPTAAAPSPLGDVVINLDAAVRQAAAHGLSPAEETRFLVIHGLLHLLGHDHHDRDERARMEAEEQRLWEALGGEGRIRGGE